MPALFPFSRFPDFVVWAEELALRYGLKTFFLDPSTIVLAGRDYGLIFCIDNDGVSLGFLEAVPNTRLVEYDLGSYLGDHRPNPEAFTKGLDPYHTPYIQSVPLELRMYRILLEGAEDILRGDKRWIAEIGARPFQMSADSREKLSAVFKK